MPDTKTISSIERERAKFAYECAEQVLSLKDAKFDGMEIRTAHVINKAFQKVEERFKKENRHESFLNFMSEPKKNMRNIQKGKRDPGI